MHWCQHYKSSVRMSPHSSVIAHMSPGEWIFLCVCSPFYLPPEFPVVFIPLLFWKGTLTGVLSCWEERLQFSWSVTVCFHSFLRFSSCPRKQCTDTVCADLNHVQNKGLGGAGRFGKCSLSWKMEQILAWHDEKDDGEGAICWYPSPYMAQHQTLGSSIQLLAEQVSGVPNSGI